jgi:hypothetical protein
VPAVITDFFRRLQKNTGLIPSNTLRYILPNPKLLTTIEGFQKEYLLTLCLSTVNGKYYEKRMEGLRGGEA